MIVLKFCEILAAVFYLCPMLVVSYHKGHMKCNVLSLIHVVTIHIASYD